MCQYDSLILSRPLRLPIAHQICGSMPIAAAIASARFSSSLPAGLSATTSSHEIVSAWRARARYFNTFASSPLQGAVGLAVLDEIEDRGLVAQAAAVGAALKSGLRERLDPDRRPWMAEVRGVGLFLGIEIVADPATLEPDAAKAVDIVNRLKDAGFLTSNAGAHRNVIKIRPPLVFSDADAAEFLTAFDSVLADLDA